MKTLILMLWPMAAFASPSFLPTAFPVFLKAGFSSVLEFDESPLRVVLGDGQSFQVEKVDKALVVRTLVPYAASNLFVYFKEETPRLFILTASEDANPTYYQKFDKALKFTGNYSKESSLSFRSSKGTASRSLHPLNQPSSLQLIKAQFDAKKDYLTLECKVTSTSEVPLKPAWTLIRLSFKSLSLKPFKLWAEREVVQKDTQVRMRLIFVKPSLPRDLRGVRLLIPLQESSETLSIELKETSR